MHIFTACILIIFNETTFSNFNEIKNEKKL